MSQPGVLEFRDFRLDVAEERLWRDERPVELRPKTFAVLKYLAERPGKLVKNDELLDVVWEGAAVTAGTLNTSIRELRKALGDDAREPSYIETVHRRGFRFVAPVRTGVGSATSETKPSHALPIPTGAAKGKLHGREGELDLLETRLASAKEGRRQVVFVTGDIGIGKTSVLRAFVERHEQEIGEGGLSLAQGQSVHHHGEGEAYHPVLDALERLVRTGGRERLPDIMKRFAPTWVVQLPWLLEPSALAELRASVGTVTTARMLREFSVMVDAFTREQPFVLLLEDMHWSDPATVDLVGALARRTDSARLLVIATYRPVDAAMGEHPVTPLHRRLRQESAASEVSLPALSEADVSSYLCERFAWSEVPTGLATVVHEQTDGNPLLMVTLTSHLVSTQVLTQVDGAWSLNATPESVATEAPGGLGEIVDERLESLGREEREALEVASVAGESFAVQAVAAAIGVDAGELERTCARLAEWGQFIEESGVAEWPDGTAGRRFDFEHSAFRRILYSRLSPARRRRLHIRIAERTEAAFARDPNAHAAELAFHYEQGGDVARSVEHLARAAASSGSRFKPREAASYARRAIELLASTARAGLGDPGERALRLELARSVAALSMRSAETDASLERCLELSRKLRDARPEAEYDGSELEHAQATVGAALDRLPDEQKEAVLHYVSGLPRAEIARVTATSKETVASRVLGGLTRLGDELERPVAVLE